jgi:hypothetical protein
MKIDSKSSIVQMEPDVLKNLVREVKETLATGIQLPEVNKRSLTFSDLWNIHRNGKTARGRFNW